MYQEYYGLAERPFDLTPNPRYLYLTPMHREALAAVQYGITARRGIVVVAGEAGTGKTTIVRAALRALKGQRVRHSYLNNPALTRAEFLQFLARAFGLGANSAGSKVDLLSELTAKLARYHGADTTTVLIVDEAQSLPHELLEEIRLLANIETSTAKLLQVVLVGQPELADRLNDPALRQLKQRVAIRARLEPLDLRSTSSFIAGRLRVAGGQPAAIFTPQAVQLVYQYSGGVARTINVICDNALLAGFAMEMKPIGPSVIDEVAKDFDLRRLDAAAGHAHPVPVPSPVAADLAPHVRVPASPAPVAPAPVAPVPAAPVPAASIPVAPAPIAHVPVAHVPAAPVAFAPPATPAARPMRAEPLSPVLAMAEVAARPAPRLPEPEPEAEPAPMPIVAPPFVTETPAPALAAAHLASDVQTDEPPATPADDDTAPPPRQESEDAKTAGIFSSFGGGKRRWF